MHLEYYSTEKLVIEIKNIISKYLGTKSYKLFFFGSRVKGNHFLHSDIDIGIEGEDELKPDVKLKIEEELEEIPTLYKLDFVDFKNISSDFRNEALKNKEYI